MQGVVRVAIVFVGLALAAGGCTTGSGPAGRAAGDGALTTPETATPWRHARSTLHLSAMGPAPGAGPFRFSGREATSVSVALNSVAAAELAVEARCDGAVDLVQVGAGALDRDRRLPPEALRFVLAPRERDRTWLAIAPEVTQCALRITPAGGVTHSLRMEREELFAPALERLDAPPPTICAAPAPRDRLEAVFLADHGLSMSCPLEPGSVRLLDESLEAFQAKVEALTGAPLPASVIERGDITAPIDFSRAPQLDLIYLSSLQMRADFSAIMIARMLAWHAERGATVRIILTESLEPGIDRRFYEGLAARYPNIQLQLFRWRGGAGHTGGPLDRIHRAHHVKVFATLAREPGRSVFMVGGRNLHDGFVLDEPRDLSPWPWLRDYNRQGRFSLGFFAVYRDFEIALAGDAAVAAMTAHMGRFWHRDHDTQALRPGAVAGTPGTGAAGAARRTGVRHFLSLPYADGHAQEDLYIALLDAARERIDLVSPFLNLPPRIEAAMERALARGVRIRLLTRTEIPEPATDFVVSLNRMFIRRYAERMAIWAHDPSQATLHSKIVVVDGRLAVVTSTNLNQRSFWHDTENGVMILDTAIAGALIGQIDRYQQRSTLQGTTQEISPLLERLMSQAFVRQFF